MAQLILLLLFLLAPITCFSAPPSELSLYPVVKTGDVLLSAYGGNSVVLGSMLASTPLVNYWSEPLDSHDSIIATGADFVTAWHNIITYAYGGAYSTSAYPSTYQGNPALMVISLKRITPYSATVPSVWRPYGNVYSAETTTAAQTLFPLTDDALSSAFTNTGSGGGTADEADSTPATNGSVNALNNTVVNTGATLVTKIEALTEAITKMEPAVITQSLSFLLGSFISIAFVLAVRT